MNSKCLFIVFLTLFTFAAARPKNKILGLGTESEPETKIREKRKYEIPLLRQLEESGVGIKREAALEKEEAVKSEAATAAVKSEESVKSEAEGGPRVKKQTHNNVGGCGKTVCGPVVSARGPVVSDMRAMMQGTKPVLSLGDLQAAVMNEMNDAPSKMDNLTPVHGRTVDTIVAPVTLGTLGYGTPAAYSAPPPAVDLSHSFFKPPSVPAVAVIAAPHQPSHSLIHPWLLPHLMPHLMPHLVPSLMSNIGSFIPHRFEPSRLPEPIPTEIKQPAPSFPQPYFGASADSALICQPYRNQRLEGFYDYYYKPDLDKSINVTDGSKKSQNFMNEDEDRRIHEHLKKVNEIKEEIHQLNRAAQRIVDQQEKLTAMQQKQLWNNGGQSSHSSEHMTTPYMGSGYFAHPSMPWGYSRSNIFTYPRSNDDIDFFINLLRAGKKMGLLSDTVQPTSALSTIGDILKGDQNGGKTQKDATDGASFSEDVKTGKLEKKSGN